MMPVYFHLASHIWIAYLFFFNGLLIHSYFRYVSAQNLKKYSEMTHSFESSVLAIFFISLAVNGCLLVLLDLLNLGFSTMQLILPLISVSFLSLVFKTGISKVFMQLTVDVDWWRLCLYAFVFVILFYNGGLIEQTADSWWHMSLANKIGLNSSFDLDGGHLSGVATRYYPPLWHANLGMANVVSDVSVPVLWNSFTAWGGVLKVMGFYLLALALSGNKTISVLSAALFVFLPGMGDSYLRVSAWPSHIAYTAMFCLFYLSFWMLDNYRRESESIFVSIYKNVIKQSAAHIAFVILAIQTFFIHQLELLWFYVGILSYVIGFIIYQFLSKEKNVIEGKENDLVKLTIYVVVLLGIGFSIYGLISDWERFEGNPDRLIICVFFLCLFIVFSLLAVCLYKGLLGKFRVMMLLCLSISVVLILLSVDVRHLVSLINPELAYPSLSSHERPLLINGFWGGELKLPGWHLQLRSALLYTGLLSIPISIVLLVFKPSRLTLFISANAIIAFLFCISPYLYQWLAGVLSYHSTWRVATLIFHPIIIATTIYYLWKRIVRHAAE